MRTFIAVKLPTKILMQIKEIQEALPEFSGKKTELKNLHLTLKFLGEISYENVEEIKSRLSKINFSKFEPEIEECGFFDKQNRGIIWLGITNCENLQKEIDNSLEGLYERENRFMGHLTIARTRKISSKKKFISDLKKIKIPTMFFIVDKFYLMESGLKEEGPEYKVIEEYCLD
ncbi:MAG: RNA 2',3'-cyclic phosphodiesterase [Candidatus Pacearchaeota archaeon]|nr:RNA 2',3'-cyclic phosphodiesterase [Candidatus Pacearchaeota archaeon]